VGVKVHGRLLLPLASPKEYHGSVRPRCGPKNREAARKVRRNTLSRHPVYGVVPRCPRQIQSADNPTLCHHSLNRHSQIWRPVAIKTGIVASEELAFQAVRFEQDISRDVLSLDLQELSEAVDGLSDAPMDRRVASVISM